MKTVSISALCAAMLLVCAGGAALAGPVEDLSARLRGRSGEAVIDNRQDKLLMKVFGHDVRGGCQGVKTVAKVTITEATGVLKGDTAAMDVAYSGEYEKAVCTEGAGAPEKKRLTGHYLFSVTSKPFQPLAVTEGDLAPGFGESPDRQDESNRLAVEAMKKAVAGAF